MAKANILREQRLEMSNTFVAIRQKVADAQVAIRNLNNKAEDLKEQKVEAGKRYDDAHARCEELRGMIADRERDLADAENQIPLAKSKMHELESMCGENKYFEKVLERTRREVIDVEKRKNDVHRLAKEKTEDCWQAKQKLHKLELRIEEVDRKIEFCTRRIIVAQERMAAAGVQSNVISKNYTQLSKNEMENKYYEKQAMVSEAKQKRKVAEEKAMKLSLQVDELDKEVNMYHDKLQEMFSGHRELSSSKLF